jgi:hypothetical protein
VHAIAGGERIVESPQDHNAAPVAADGPASIQVKGTAVAVRRQYATFCVQIAGPLWDNNGNASGESYVTLPGEQTLTGKNYGNE